MTYYEFIKVVVIKSLQLAGSGIRSPRMAHFIMAARVGWGLVDDVTSGAATKASARREKCSGGFRCLRSPFGPISIGEVSVEAEWKPVQDLLVIDSPPAKAEDMKNPPCIRIRFPSPGQVSSEPNWEGLPVVQGRGLPPSGLRMTVWSSAMALAIRPKVFAASGPGRSRRGKPPRNRQRWRHPAG
jgi:hypothetical protein